MQAMKTECTKDSTCGGVQCDSSDGNCQKILEKDKFISGDGDSKFTCSPRYFDAREQNALIVAETKLNPYFQYNKYAGRCVKEAGNVELLSGNFILESGDFKFSECKAICDKEGKGKCTAF